MTCETAEKASCEVSGRYQAPVFPGTGLVTVRGTRGHVKTTQWTRRAVMQLLSYTRGNVVALVFLHFLACDKVTRGSFLINLKTVGQGLHGCLLRALAVGGTLFS